VKRFFRTPWVQSCVAWLVSIYLGLTLRSMRWRFENQGPVDAAIASPDGAIACFWHGRIALAPVCRALMKDKPRRVIISPSPDGEFVAKVVGRLGFPAIRGTAALTDKRRTKAGAFTFRDAMKFIAEGGVLIITPDGPRGPAQLMPLGPVMMARMRETPVYVFGLAARPAIRLKSWDAARIPLPFGRGCVVFDGPLTIARRSGDDVIEATRADWEVRLNAAQARAEAWVDRS
jgi:lysophospholipid acyltransferase (LPLAT)-like uncharacterized protein